MPLAREVAGQARVHAPGAVLAGDFVAVRLVRGVGLVADVVLGDLVDRNGAAQAPVQPVAFDARLDLAVVLRLGVQMGRIAAQAIAPRPQRPALKRKPARPRPGRADAESQNGNQT